MAQKCVHKGCGKTYTDPEDECIYHPGPPEFHEGQKGWKCCKARVLTFDEFLSIPPCTTGTHSTVDDTPVPMPKPSSDDVAPKIKPISTTKSSTSTSMPSRGPQPPKDPTPVQAPPGSDSDDPSLPIKPQTACRRRGCNVSSGSSISSSPRDDEECVHHPGQPIFHEGNKGWTCCKKRVLDFDEFMHIEGCKTKRRHLYVGSGKKSHEEEQLAEIRQDFYQTPTSVIASLYLKKIDKSRAKVDFSSSTTLELDLPTSDSKRYTKTVNLYGPIDPDKSTYKIMGTKLELTLVKTDGSGWPVLRRDDRSTGEIIQVGRAGRA